MDNSKKISRLYCVILFALLINFISFEVYSQTTSVTSSSSSSSNNNTVGTAGWSNMSNILTSDDAYTTVSALVLGDKSKYLLITGFGFSIPPTAIIQGVTVEVQKRATGVLQNVVDNSVKIVKGGAITGNNKALATVWPTTKAYSVYGGNADNWGTTWSPSDINSSNFGIAISANLAGVSALPSAQIDHVRLTVNYIVPITPLPIDLLFFQAGCEDNNVLIEWGVASQTDNDYFTIERSSDGVNYDVVDTIAGAGTYKYRLDYSFIDANPFEGVSYYRLKQTDFDGTYEYFEVKAVSREHSALVKVYSPLSNDKIIIEFEGDNKTDHTLSIYSIQGQLKTTHAIKENKSIVDISMLDGGLYFYRLESANNVLLKSGNFLVQGK